jgi:hypothetical protein
MSAPLIKQSNLALLHILQVFSPVHSGSNIFFKICLSNIHSLLLSCSFRVHISEAHVTTGLLRVRYSFLTFFILQFCICIVCSVSFVNSLRNFRLNTEPPKTTHILTFWITNLYIHIFKKKDSAYIIIRPLKFFSLFHSQLK